MRRVLSWLVVLLAAVAAALTALGALHEPARWPPPSGDREVRIDGVPIRYRQAGSGRDVVLAHGSPGSVEDWEPVWEQLASRYRVTAFDRPGHGYSGGRGDSVEGNARVARGLIAALGLRHVVFVGHSYGGAVALQLAVADPPELAAYVLVAARAYGPINLEPIYRLLAVPWLGTGFARVAGRLVAPRIVRRGILASFAPNQGALPDGFVGQRIALWSQPRVAVAAALERVGFERSLEAMGSRYSAIRKPVFVVVGDSDAAPLASAARLAREVPGARLEVLPATGHYVQHARPDELVRAIHDAATVLSAAR